MTILDSWDSKDLVPAADSQGGQCRHTQRRILDLPFQPAPTRPAVGGTRRCRVDTLVICCHWISLPPGSGRRPINSATLPRRNSVAIATRVLRLGEMLDRAGTCGAAPCGS